MPRNTEAKNGVETSDDPAQTLGLKQLNPTYSSSQIRILHWNMWEMYPNTDINLNT